MCAIRSNAGRGSIAPAGRAQFLAKLLLDSSQEFFDAYGVDHIFHARLETVGAIPGIDEDPHDGICDLGRVRRLDDDSGILGEILVAGDPADAQAKPDARLNAEAILHFDRRESDIVGVFEYRDLAGAVESDVELARQSSQRAIVEDVVVPFTGIGARVDQFLRIDPGSRRARDVADIVGAGSARTQSDVLDPFDQRHAVLGRNLPDLDIGAGGDMRIAAAATFGEIGNTGKLPVLENSVGNAQAAHEGVLRRRDIEQAVKAPAEIVRRRRRRVALAPAPSNGHRHRTDAARA